MSIWRQEGRLIYGADGKCLIGMMDTPGLANLAVRDHNAADRALGEQAAKKGPGGDPRRETLLAAQAHDAIKKDIATQDWITDPASRWRRLTDVPFGAQVLVEYLGALIPGRVVMCGDLSAQVDTAEGRMTVDLKRLYVQGS